VTIYVVSGSRSLKDKKNEVLRVIIRLVKPNDIIITGGAEGVDTIVEEYCKNRGIVCLVLKPINKYYNLPYTPLYYLARDKQMVDMAHEAIIIWDGKSRGTKFTREYAETKEMRIHLTII
jgi:hypothetical protein